MLVTVPRTKCNYCSKLIPEGDMLTFSGNVRFCAKCWENHLKATRMLSGQGWIDECQCCGTPITTLMEREGTENIKMAIVAKDGIYQYVCLECKPKYLAKRKDLFEGTMAEGLYGN